MFVVRIVIDEDREDYKVFKRKEDAVARFDAAWIRTDDGDFESCCVFEVTDATSERDAADAVKRGQTERLILWKRKRTSEVEVAEILLDVQT